MLREDAEGFEYTRDFRKAFELHLDESTLSEFAERYLREVEKQISVMEQIFEEKIN